MKLTPILVALIALIALPAWAGTVGFQELTITDGSDKPLTVGVWYPTEAAATPTTLQTFTQTVAAGAPVAGHALPLVVMSHGTGAWYGMHYDTALALAEAGFVVAAVTHTGDNYEDHSQATMIWARSGQIKRLIDYMLGEWPDHARIDANRVGMFGFSAGGFTTLVVAGGVPRLARIMPHCQVHPDYFDCGLVKNVPNLASQVDSLPDSAWTHDPRVRAAVVATPALGFTFGPEGLKGVTIPIQLWRGDGDHILPNPEYAEAVRVALPRPPEYHVIANADHFDFQAPCSAQLQKFAPDICIERPGFDRAAFHAAFDDAVVRFFKKTLD